MGHIIAVGLYIGALKNMHLDSFAKRDLVLKLKLSIRERRGRRNLAGLLMQYPLSPDTLPKQRLEEMFNASEPPVSVTRTHADPCGVQVIIVRKINWELMLLLLCVFLCQGMPCQEVVWVNKYSICVHCTYDHHIQDDF